MDPKYSVLNGLHCINVVQTSQDNKYSKTCVKRQLKKDKTKILMTNGSLMKVKVLRTVLQNAPLGAFCNTFDLH